MNQCNLLTNNSVEIRWVTSSELNTSHFEVERSADATHWNTINKLLVILK